MQDTVTLLLRLQLSFFLASAIIVFKEERLWHVFAAVIIFTAILCTVVSMATNYWVEDTVHTNLYAANSTSVISTTTVKLNVGLKKFTNHTTIANGTGVIFDAQNSGTLKGSNLPFGYDANFLDRGGNFIIITGTVGLVLATASLFCLYRAETGLDALGPRGALSLWQYVQISGKKGKFFLFALLALLWTGTFSMVGTLLYASELNLKYSYELFTGAAIFYFIAAAILVSREPDTSTSGHFSQLSEALPLKRESSDLEESARSESGGESAYAGGNAYGYSGEGASSTKDPYTGFSGGVTGGSQSVWSSGLDSR